MAGSRTGVDEAGRGLKRYRRLQMAGGLAAAGGAPGLE